MKTDSGILPVINVQTILGLDGNAASFPLGVNGKITNVRRGRSRMAVRRLIVTSGSLATHLDTR